MAENTDKLNKFLADLAVLNIKVHNLHWNVVGMEFKAIHKMTEKIYEMLQNQFDEVAEVLKMQNKLPLATIAEYLDNTEIEELESRPYQADEVLEILSDDCNLLINKAKQIREDADKKDNFLVVNLMEDYLKIYAKKSWMIRSMLEEEPAEFE